MPSKPKPSPTIYDVAKAANLHPATVSKVLSGKYRFGTASAERVLQVAEEMGFVPDRRASHLARKRSHPATDQGLIPVVLLTQGRRRDNESSRSPEKLFRSIGTTIPDGAQESARSLGYFLERMNLYGMNAETVGRQLYSRGVEGLLLGSLYPFDAQPPLPWEHFSMVAIGESSLGHAFDRVNCDLFSSVRLAAGIARERGYQRLGFVLPQHDVDSDDDDRRLAAALLVQQKETGVAIKPLLYPVRRDHESLLRPWLKEERPDCVISFSAATSYKLQDCGVDIPRDVGFVCLHGGHETAARHGIATVVAVRSHEIFNRALRILDSHIRHNVRGQPRDPTCTLLAPLFVDGPTLPPKRRSRKATRRRP